MRGKGLASPWGFIPQYPCHGQSPCGYPGSHLTSLNVSPWHMGLCSMLGHPRHLGLRQGSLQAGRRAWGSPPCWGASLAVPLHDYPWPAEPEQGCSPPLLRPHHQYPSVPLHLMGGGRPDISGISPHPGMGCSSCPVPWDAWPAGARHQSSAMRKISK